MSRKDKPFRTDCEHDLQLLPMIDFHATFICTRCGGVRAFPALDLSTKTPEALEAELRAELGGTPAFGPLVPTEPKNPKPRHYDHPTGSVLNEVYTNHEDIALNHLGGAGIAFIEYLDAWIDKGLADGTLTIEKGARYREAIAARCAELGEVPHVREHIAALQLKAGDILGIVAPSGSSALMQSMAKYTRSLLDAVGNEGVGALVFPPGTEFHVLEGAATQVSDTIRQFVQEKLAAGVMTQERFREMLEHEIRRQGSLR